MLNNQFLDDLSQKIREMVGSTPAADINKNMRALLQGAFTKLELVTREEFDVQTEVLRRTREKLERLEQQLTELESKSRRSKKA